MEWLIELDQNILLWIQENVRSVWLDGPMLWITALGDKGYLWIALAALFLIFPKYRKAGRTIALALLFGALATNVILKPLVERIRPYEVVEGLTYIGKKYTDFSFPSGHTTASIGAAVAGWYTLPKKYAIPMLVIAIAITWTRLYLGVHYPTDILGGIVVGVVCALGACIFWKKMDQIQLEKG